MSEVVACRNLFRKCSSVACGVQSYSVEFAVRPFAGDFESTLFAVFRGAVEVLTS